MIKNIYYRFHVIKSLLPYASGVKRILIINLVINVVITIINLINPQFYKIFINQVILGKEIAKMVVVISGYLLAFVLSTGLGYLKLYAENTSVNHILYQVKLKILKNYFEMPFEERERYSIGDLKFRLEDDSNQIDIFTSSQTIQYLMAYITVIISFLLLVFTDWRLTLFSVVVIPITYILDSIISKKEGQLNESNRKNDEEFTSWLNDSIHAWKLIKILNLQKIQRIKFVRYIHNYALYFAKWINCWTFRVLVIPKMKDDFLMRFGLYFIGGFLIMSGKIQIGDLLVFSVYFDMLSNAFKTISSCDADLQGRRPYLDRLLNEISRVQNSDNCLDINLERAGTIQFDNVSFAYSATETKIIDKFNLIINPGERVAITGKSGCGKTTLLKLMTGMLQPTSGRILFGGINISQINITMLHKKIGFVMQENMLFNMSIKENLLLAKEDATELELRGACKKAHLLEYIDSLSEGFETIIGERGEKLSGGQQQRLVLARLFLRDVDVFIFDEATSELDPYNENIIHEAINSIDCYKTIIIVSHRESSIQLCDRLIRLDT